MDDLGRSLAAWGATLVSGTILVFLESSLFPLDKLLHGTWGVWLMLWCISPMFLSFGWMMILNSESEHKRLHSIVYFIAVVLVLFSPIIILIPHSSAEFSAYPVSYSSPVPLGHETPSHVTKRRPSLIIISDSHITDLQNTLEGQPDGKVKLERIFDLLKQLDPRLCIIAGDLTDQGDPKEWTLFKSILYEKLGPPQTRSTTVLLIPGNHDMQGSPFTAPADDLISGNVSDLHYNSIKYFKRARSFLELAQSEEWWLDSVMGITLGASTLPALIEDLLADYARKTIKYYAEPSTNRASQPHSYTVYPVGFDNKMNNAKKGFQELFPLVYEDRTEGLIAVLLNSSSIVHNGSDMGLGDLTTEQLQRLQVYLSGLLHNKTLKVLVVALHHPSARRQTDSWSWQDAIRRKTESDIWAHTYLSLNANESKQLVVVLESFAEARKDVQVVLTHGHRHEKYLGRTPKGVWIIEAPAVIQPVDHVPGFWAAYLEPNSLEIKWTTSRDLKAS